jgi:Protein of unknown function (DUF2490)
MPKDKSFFCLGTALCVCVSATRIVAFTLFLLVFGIGTRSAKAQESVTRNEFWPEIDVYIHVKPKVRLYLIGTVSKSVEDGEIRNAQGFEAQIGAHIDYIPNDHLILRTGYRYGSSVGDSDDSFKEHRLLTEQTLRKMLPGELLLSDRNREDFRFVDGDFSFRYRNRVSIEREVPVFKGRTITPYVSAEIFYDTRSSAWNRNRLAAGFQQSLRRGPLRRMLLPKRQIILDLYFMRQNDSSAETQHVNAVGAALAFYF